MHRNGRNLRQVKLCKTNKIEEEKNRDTNKEMQERNTRGQEKAANGGGRNNRARTKRKQRDCRKHNQLIKEY